MRNLVIQYDPYKGEDDNKGNRNTKDHLVTQSKLEFPGLGLLWGFGLIFGFFGC